MTASRALAEGSPRVLVVEDEAIVAADIASTLERQGYAVDTAGSAAEAIARAERSRADVVVMDIRLGAGADGVETADRLRQRFGVPVVFLTAHGDPETVARAMASGPHGYLVKPFRATELLTAVEVALTRDGLERELRERERVLSTTLRSIADAVITTDEEGRVTFANGRAEELAGWGPGQAQGRELAAAIALRDAESGEPVELPVARALRELSPAFIPLAVVGRNGDERAVTGSVAPVEDGDDLFGAVAVLHDLTEERALKKRLELADRLAAAGTLAAGVAHEIMTPLTFVKANVEYALGEIGARRLPGSERVMPALEDAREGTSRVERIVSELRSFTRRPQGRAAPVELRPALEWAVGVTAHLWHGRASVPCEFAETPRVLADSTRLGQVFVNLLTNAAQAIRPGAPQENQIRVSCRTGEDGWAVAEVADTGEGMRPEVAKRIFEPFFTTKSGGKGGTGLGLAISHDIVQSLGGRIEVESVEGKGSVFRVLLPPSDV